MYRNLYFNQSEKYRLTFSTGSARFGPAKAGNLFRIFSLCNSAVNIMQSTKIRNEVCGSRLEIQQLLELTCTELLMSLLTGSTSLSYPRYINHGRLPALVLFDPTYIMISFHGRPIKENPEFSRMTDETFESPLAATSTVT